MSAAGAPAQARGHKQAHPVAGLRRTLTVDQLVTRALRELHGTHRRYRRSLIRLAEGVPELPADADLPPGYRLAAREHPPVPGLGTQPADRITQDDLERLGDSVRRYVSVVMQRRRLHRAAGLIGSDPDMHGQGAQAHFVEAMRWFWGDWMRPWVTDNPADRLHVPTDHRERMPLGVPDLVEIFQVLTTLSRDPVLDTLLVEGVLRSAARQEGMLNLTVASADLRAATLRLDEKGARSRTVPVLRAYLHRLVTVMAERGAHRPSDPLFRYADGHPLTGRRFDTISNTLDRHTTWTAAIDLGPHHLRHTTLHWLRLAGVSESVRRAIAGHTIPGATDRYTHPQPDELVEAMEAVFGPLSGPLLHRTPAPLDLTALSDRLGGGAPVLAPHA